MKPITIAIFDLEERAKQAVLDAGGRVQIATTTVNGAQDYTDAQSVYLVTLPQSADVREGTAYGYHLISLYPAQGVEVILRAYLIPGEASLYFVDRAQDQGGSDV